MKLGIINESDFSLTNPEDENWKIHSFTISTSSLSFSEIVDSAFATPARYLQEIFFRLCLLEEPGRETPKFVFNPLFETNRLNILLVLGTLQKVASSPCIVVLTDRNGLPAGYLFPAWLKSGDSRFLILLSTVNGDTDAELLRRAFFAEAKCVRVDRLYLNQISHNGFSYDDVRKCCQWIAARAVGILKTRIPYSPMDEVALREAKEYRDTIPFTAVMPHHAGDVLFFAIAFNNINTHFSQIVVNHAYLDIVTHTAPGLAALAIHIPPPNRDENFRRGNVTPEHVYFENFRDTLPEDSFYYYCRATRNYNLSDFHLIDHFAFALGRHSWTNDSLLFSTKPSPALFTPDVPADPIRVLLHFDGGWSLKIYPKKSQEKLIDLLHAQGYAITVLASVDYEHPKCRVTTFRNYAQFTDLLKTHHILVGMDSFPCHYSAHVLGLPTICLFSSTKPANSNAPLAVNYAYLEIGLSCRPCYAVVECPVYRKPHCKNFVSPEAVANEVAKMLRTVGAQRQQGQSAPSPHRADDDCQPSLLTNGKKKIKRINMNHLDIKVLLAGTLLPYFRYSSTLYRDFAAATRREGIVPAVQKAIRFIYRAVSRSN